VQRCASARSRGLISDHAPHDEATPAGARKRIARSGSLLWFPPLSALSDCHSGRAQASAPRQTRVRFRKTFPKKFPPHIFRRMSFDLVHSERLKAHGSWHRDPVSLVGRPPRTLCRDRRRVRRTFASNKLNKKRTALSGAVEKSKERKQFCAFSARRRFHTAWTHSGLDALIRK
jgi:hypothetical protein